MEKKSEGGEKKTAGKDGQGGAGKDSRSSARALATAEQTEERQAISQMGRRQFEERFTELARGFSTDQGNPGSYGCTGCQRCTNCMFCKDCDTCYQCTHCTRCKHCSNCSHCVDSNSLTGCAYCVESEACTNSAYLVRCRKLSDCTYCFGCVGLSKKDFHILNVPFSRTEYFKAVARLKKELGID